MPDFWRSAGLHLLERGDDGYLGVTDDFLRAYLMRPEVRPVEDSCAAETALHAALMEDPRRPVDPARIQALGDPDARHNYRVLLDFLGRLAAAGTVEGCYLGMFRSGSVAVPPLFIDQMAHVIVRNILGDVPHPLCARAGELFFRQQTVTIQEGAVLMADSDTVEMYATTGGYGDLGRLLVQAGAKTRRVDLDVLGNENADTYWGRDERYDTVLETTFSRPGLDALCRVLEGWIRHFLRVETRIQPVRRIDDRRWMWHAGLDAEASALLDDLYNGVEVDEERMRRLLALFRLEFAVPAPVRPGLEGRPVYLAMAMTPGRTLRLKPQNLLVNLPLAGLP